MKITGIYHFGGNLPKFSVKVPLWYEDFSSLSFWWETPQIFCRIAFVVLRFQVPIILVATPQIFCKITFVV